jgi:Rps23 Pro-64 3,4-dihydroxylase Tpa1-like proline 4-hydroxylase
MEKIKNYDDDYDLKSLNKRRILHSDNSSSKRKKYLEDEIILGEKPKKTLKKEEDGDFIPLGEEDEEEEEKIPKRKKSYSVDEDFEFTDDYRDMDYEPQVESKQEVFESKRKTRNSNRLINLTEDDDDEHLGFKNLGNTCKIEG